MRKRNIKQKEVSVVTVKEKLICFNNQHMEQGKDELINNFSTSKYSIIKEENIYLRRFSQFYLFLFNYKNNVVESYQNYKNISSASSIFPKDDDTKDKLKNRLTMEEYDPSTSINLRKLKNKNVFTNDFISSPTKRNPYFAEENSRKIEIYHNSFKGNDEIIFYNIFDYC